MVAASRPSRRRLLTGLGATAGGFTLGTVVPADAVANALSAQVHPRRALRQFAAPGLAQLVIAPSAFHLATFSPNNGRLMRDGHVSVTADRGTLLAPLALPVGAIIRRIDVYYVALSGSILTLRRGLIVLSVPPVPVVSIPLLGAPRVLWNGADVDETVRSEYFYDLQLDIAHPESVYGVKIGYVPPPTFVPLTPSVRVLDTRTGDGKLRPDEERSVTMAGIVPTSAAVFNLTVTDTDPGGGFVAVFAGTSWPGNSSVNWSTGGDTVANLVVSPVDPTTGAITIRGGNAATHVVIDLLGEIL